MYRDAEKCKQDITAAMAHALIWLGLRSAKESALRISPKWREQAKHTEWNQRQTLMDDGCNKSWFSRTSIASSLTAASLSFEVQSFGVGTKIMQKLFISSDNLTACY
jgi:hypothetical protein